MSEPDHQQVVDELIALYMLISGTLGMLDACKGWEEDPVSIPWSRVRDVRRWLAAEREKIIDSRRAIMEEISDA